MIDATSPSAPLSSDLLSFIEGMPKCELHVHLEGTLSPELKLTLAERNGIDIGQTTVEEVTASYEFDSLTSFLGVYYPAMNVLQHEQDFFDLTYTYLAKAASQEVRYAEMFFDPQAHTDRGIPFETVITGYHRAAVAAREQLGLSAELILCFLRDLSAESAMAPLAASFPSQDWILGAGLDSAQRDNPPAAILLTVHAASARTGLDGLRGFGGPLLDPVLQGR